MDWGKRPFSWSNTASEAALTALKRSRHHDNSSITSHSSVFIEQSWNVKSVDSAICLHDRSHALMFPLQPNSIKSLWSEGKQDDADDNNQKMMIGGKMRLQLWLQQVRIKATKHFLFRSFWLIVFATDGHEYLRKWLKQVTLACQSWCSHLRSLTGLVGSLGNVIYPPFRQSCVVIWGIYFIFRLPFMWTASKN